MTGIFRIIILYMHVCELIWSCTKASMIDVDKLVKIVPSVISRHKNNKQTAPSNKEDSMFQIILFT